MRRVLAAVALLLLAGCVTTPPVTATLRPPQAERAAYTINGRIAVKYDSKHSSGNLHWAHTADADDVLLLAPLGMTVAHLRRDVGGAVLEASGKRYAAQDAGDLMQQVLGWRLPLDGLPYWVLALPKPGAEAAMERDANGHISVLRQDGWAIRYTRYTAEMADALPVRIVLLREGLEITLLIDEWALP